MFHLKKQFLIELVILRFLPYFVSNVGHRFRYTVEHEPDRTQIGRSLLDPKVKDCNFEALKVGLPISDFLEKNTKRAASQTGCFVMDTNHEIIR